MTDAAKDFDLSGKEYDTGRGDLLNNESPDGVALLECHRFIRLPDANPRRTPTGVGMPLGPLDRDLRYAAMVTLFDFGFDSRRHARLGAKPGLRSWSIFFPTGIRDGGSRQ